MLGNYSPSPNAEGSDCGGGVVVGGLLIITMPGHIQYLWGLLASTLFGIFLFKSRRLIFSVDKDIPPTQASLYVLQAVFDIGYTQDKFDVGVPHECYQGGAEEGTLEGSLIVDTHQHIDQKIDLTIPSTYKEGAPEIGFGTVNDNGQSVACETFGSAPAILNEEREWISGNKADGRKRTATIRNEETRRIAVGTVDDAGIHPFLLVEHGAFKKGDNGHEYPAEGDLYLHVFRSIKYAAGQYGSNLVSAIERDSLCSGGINIKSLRPLTSWRIRSAGGGKLKLEITVNQKEDVKRFKHEVVIKKNAQTSRA
ncbi:hypothetical protein AX14_003774 [Amanita brunnescens Koide BX004]|nr:hypothetical protein AX14_003774 [Amanita brunnescens Koide BX004]